MSFQLYLAKLKYHHKHLGARVYALTIAYTASNPSIGKFYI